MIPRNNKAAHGGLFLSLDGLDGTGKSTQCAQLAAWLEQLGHNVVRCADPGGTQVGSALREILLHQKTELTLATEAFLFMASRAQLVSEIIRPALDAGRTVISDRFLLANVVYQGYAGGGDIDLLWRMGTLATGGLEPDLTLVLDLSLEEARKRRSRAEDRMEGRPLDFHERVRAGFLKEVERRPEQLRLIDAGADQGTVQAKIRQEILYVLEARTRA